VDMALLNTRLAGVRYLPDELDIEWVEAP